MSKQDRQGVRTPADIERKYNLGEVRRTFEDVQKGTSLNSAISKSESKIMSSVDEKLRDYAKKDDLSDYVPRDDLDDYALKSDIPNVDDLATRGDLDSTKTVLTSSISAVNAKVDSLSVIVQGITDGQWYTLTLGTGFIARGNNSTLSPKVKASGAVITVCGIVSNSAAMTVPSEGVVIASGIPTEWRPHMDHHFVCQSANMDLWRCAVKTDGTVTLARIGTTAARDLGANTWLPFTVTYQI